MVWFYKENNLQLLIAYFTTYAHFVAARVKAYTVYIYKMILFFRPVTATCTYHESVVQTASIWAIRQEISPRRWMRSFGASIFDRCTQIIKKKSNNWRWHHLFFFYKQGGTIVVLLSELPAVTFEQNSWSLATDEKISDCEIYWRWT